jgi:hypothetical protein
MVGRADIEGSKSDVAMNAWPPVIPVVTFLTPLAENFSSQKAVLSQSLCVLNIGIKPAFALLLYAKFLSSLSWP